MQVNNNYSVQPNFAGKKQEAPQMRTMSLNDFVNASDEDLYYFAQAENKQKHKHSTAKFIGACVGVDVLSNMLLKSHVKKVVNGETKIVKAPLSAKIGTGFKSLKGWGIGFAAVGVLMGIKNAVLNKSEKFNEFEQNHPMGSLLAEVGALALGYKGVKAAGSKLGLGAKLADKTKPLTKGIDKIAKKIDNGKVSTFIMNRCSEIADKVNMKAPAMGKTCRLLLANSVLLMLIGGMMKISKNNREIEQTYQGLKTAQTQIKETMFE